MSLKVKCDRDYFVSVVKAAKQLGGKSWESFKRCMLQLGAPGEPGSTNAQTYSEIYKDFAPLSFGFARFRHDGRMIFVGGMICHGAGSTGGGGPEFSVTLNPKNFPHWQLHT